MPLLPCHQLGQLLFGVMLIVVAAGTALCAAPAPDRAAWYRESVVNVHFDNHSGLLGKGVSPEDLDAMLATIPATMLQVSAQSNAYATYATDIGLRNPAAEGYDTLAAFSEVARRQGKKLCIYMSVDRRPMELKEHPKWGAINAAGKQDINSEPIVCQRPNREAKGYLYERFLPQIREIIRKYDPDGLWFDGDYILSRPCWCPNCLKEWKVETGLDAPRGAQDPVWERWTAWHRKGYREYRRLVAEAIHTTSKKAIYTSNWSWAWTPDPVPDFIDTLSGDAWSIRQVQCATQRWGAGDTPWDIMSYCTPGARAYNRTYSLQRTLQEGALTMAAGGIWFVWSFGGHQVPPYGVDVTRQCAHFARDRQAALGPSTSLSQVAVLDSETSSQGERDSGVGSRVTDAARALAEGHYCADIVNEQTFRKWSKRYSVVVVPEFAAVAPETLSALGALAEGGGLVLLTGGALSSDEPGAAALLGLERTPPAENRVDRLDLGGAKLRGTGAWRVEPGTAKVVARFADGQPALLANQVGKGIVGYLATSVFYYPDDGLLPGILRALGRGPSYAVGGGAGEAAVLCSLRAKPGQVILHVADLTARVNGVPADVDTGEYTDFNPPLNNIRVALPFPAAPSKVRAVPTGTLVRTKHEGGLLEVTLETMHTHAAVILETPAAAPLPLLPADTPLSKAAFHVPDDRVGVLFADDFEAVAAGQPPAKPWMPENRGGTSIAVTEETAAGGKRSLCFTDTEESSFWPFLHRSVAPFRRGRARLAFDLRVDPGADCLVEARYEGKGPGPSIHVAGDGRVIASGKPLATVTPGTWHHYEIEFALGAEDPIHSLSIAAPGKEPQRFADIPNASEWFFRCDSVYFVGSGQKPGRFYLDNVAFERLPGK